jgi:uncharacterized protein (TIGR03437 family)
VWDSLAVVTNWPDHDLFPQYYPPSIVPGVVNSASFAAGPLAPASLATVLGADLGGASAEVAVWVRDAGGVERPAHLLYSGEGQLNTVLPADTAPGEATLIVRRQGWPDATAALQIVAVSPGLFTLNQAGLAAATLVRSRAGGQASWEPIYEVDDAGSVIAKPIVFGGEEEEPALVLYCTGVRGHGTQAVTVHLGERTFAASYAGPQLQFEGLDQINVTLPRALAGAGDVGIRVEADGSVSNSVWVRFR